MENSLNHARATFGAGVANLPLSLRLLLLAPAAEIHISPNMISPFLSSSWHYRTRAKHMVNRASSCSLGWSDRHGFRGNEVGSLQPAKGKQAAKEGVWCRGEQRESGGSQ